MTMDRIAYKEALKMCKSGEFVMFHIDWRDDLVEKHPECSHFLFKSTNKNWKTETDGVVLVVGDHDHICAEVSVGRIKPDMVEDLIAQDSKLGDRLWQMNAQKSVTKLLSFVDKLCESLETECARVGCEEEVLEILGIYKERLMMFDGMVGDGYRMLPEWSLYEAPTRE